MRRRSVLGAVLVAAAVLGGFYFVNGGFGSPADRPVVAYDWSTFEENERLSEDFTRAVKEVADPGHTEQNPHWLRMKRAMFSEIGYLGVRELTINLLRGYKGHRRVGFTMKLDDGTVAESFSTTSERYRFPMVVVFQPDGALVVKTNGLEKRLDYAKTKEELKEDFTWMLYAALSDQFETTPKYRERRSQAAAAAEEAEQERLDEAKRSWQ